MPVLMDIESLDVSYEDCVIGGPGTVVLCRDMHKH